uniref:acyl carrier protein n=1 Tax=Chattonella marina TaxID=90936 RepID=UPI0021144A65|nr:acyl carrier protein [Chattonella marina]UTE94802.1 acyl carrier protein [Chattonella marina]
MDKFENFAQVLTRVREVVADQFCIEPVESLDSEANFIKDLGADSLDVVELVMALEESFEIEVSDEYTSQIQTVEQAAEIIADILDIAND